MSDRFTVIASLQHANFSGPPYCNSGFFRSLEMERLAGDFGFQRFHVSRPCKILEILLMKNQPTNSKKQSRLVRTRSGLSTSSPPP